MAFSATALSTEAAPVGATGNGHLPPTIVGVPEYDPGSDDFAALRGMVELLHRVAQKAGVPGKLVLAGRASFFWRLDYNESLPWLWSGPRPCG